MTGIDKRDLSETDIRTKYITPAIERAGWDIMNQVREEVFFTAGKVTVRGRVHQRGKAKKADYILYHKPGIPIAIVEAKDNKHSVGDGMQQGLDYAEILNIPFVYSSNGNAFLEHDRLAKGNCERTVGLDAFPSPTELWKRYCAGKNLSPEQEAIVAQDYYFDTTNKFPRYYQQNAINQTVEAIAKGQNRILLVMATGTGKTYTAFQIIHRLWKARVKKRILFLVDRNILADQAKNKDFAPFGDKMTKITGRNIDKAYEVYLALYQAITGTEESQNIYKRFSPDFFDLIVIDECHRGSAADDAAWREILTYFDSATHIGLTATPKETAYVSNIGYFGEPVYTYSLKQGIEDGFLAPYKVIRFDLDRDLEGWRPEDGKRDKNGQLIDDRIYNLKDFDRTMILEKRTKLVAEKVSQYLKGTNRYDKTIVFCENIDHAERMRHLLVNENSDIAADNRKYVMRITGDNAEGKAELDNFILPDSAYPVIATTSKLMTTGVDAQTCKLIVIDQTIQSLSLFKQIIGRGTRINEDYGKYWFTIMDFRKSTELFADPDFDGPPISIKEPGIEDDPSEGEEIPGDETDSGDTPEDGFPNGDGQPGGDGGPEGPTGKPYKFVVDDVEVKVLSERVLYYGKDGKLITESLKDYTKKMVLKEYRTLDEFLNKWTSSEQKRAMIDELTEQGIFLDALADEIDKDMDPFDLVCHIAYGQPPLTRKERAENVKKRDYFTKYGDRARAVLQALLDKYADTGVQNLEDINILKIQPFDELGTPMEILDLFGGKQEYMNAIRDLEAQLYSAA